MSAAAVAYLQLGAAILVEVGATAFLKQSDGMSRLFPTIASLLGYGISFYLLSQVLKIVPMTVYNSKTGKRERIGRILKMHANKREDVKWAGAGDIVALVGLKNASTGDTLCDEKREVILESLNIPDPVIEVAIEPKTKADRDALSAALNKLAKEDPSFRVKGDDETNQTLIAGMGELHLEIIVDRLTREFNVNANVGKPQVAYRETISKPAKSDLKYAKQSGGRGQYGHVVIEVEPNPGKGYEFVNSITGGVIPKEYIPAVDKGINDALKAGVLAGFPVVDVKVNLVFGSYHEVDSSEQAFYVAGSMPASLSLAGMLSLPTTTEAPRFLHHWAELGLPAVAATVMPAQTAS